MQKSSGMVKLLCFVQKMNLWQLSVFFFSKLSDWPMIFN